MRRRGRENASPRSTIQDPAAVQALVADVRFAWLWLAVRLSVGWLWLDAGWRKLEDPTWRDGRVLQAAWEQAARPVPEMSVVEVGFLDVLNILLDTRCFTWLGEVVAVGQILVGIALILGLCTGLAAFLGGAISLSGALLGAATTDPAVFVPVTGLVLAWKTAGWIGLDRWLLPLLGVPAPGGALLRREGVMTGQVPPM